jgi:hypothetical protein
MVSKADKKLPMCVRLAAIGGSPVRAGLEARKWPARQMPSVVRDFGMIRDPAVAKLMLSLVGKASVKDGPLAWFRAHADYARPLLEKQTSVVAKGVLHQLGVTCSCIRNWNQRSGFDARTTCARLLRVRPARPEVGA